LKAQHVSKGTPLIIRYHVESSINFEIINSITKLHLVGISIESPTMHGSMNIKLRIHFAAGWTEIFGAVSGQRVPFCYPLLI